MIKARIESVVFGDFSEAIVLPEALIDCTDINTIVDYVLNECKTFRKYGRHLNESFILWFE